MTASDLKNLSDLIDVLRAKGVRSFRDTSGPREVEFTLDPIAAPVTAPDAIRETLEKAAETRDLCACKHPEYAHNGGLCLAGCDESQCNPAVDE